MSTIFDCLRRSTPTSANVCVMPALDTSTLADIAHRLNAHAAAIRDLGIGLERAVAATGWRGRAADAFHAQAHHALRTLYVAAARLDAAATALRRHAGRVEQTIRDAKSVMSDALHTFGDLATNPGALGHDISRLAGDAVHMAGDLVGAR